MLPVTSGRQTGDPVAESTRWNATVETLALLFVIIFLIAMLLAVTTAFQHGLW